MSFSEYGQIANTALDLPIGGVVYHIPEVTVGDGLKLQQLIHDGNLPPALDVYRLVLGSAGKQMLHDKVPVGAYIRAGMTALANFQAGRAVAEATWETGADPERLAAYLVSTGKDAAPTTPTPVSTSGTKTSPQQPQADQ